MWSASELKSYGVNADRSTKMILVKDSPVPYLGQFWISGKFYDRQPLVWTVGPVCSRWRIGLPKLNFKNQHLVCTSHIVADFLCH